MKSLIVPIKNKLFAKLLKAADMNINQLAVSSDWPRSRVYWYKTREIPACHFKQLRLGLGLSKRVFWGIVANYYEKKAIDKK